MVSLALSLSLSLSLAKVEKFVFTCLHPICALFFLPMRQCENMRQIATVSKEYRSRQVAEEKESSSTGNRLMSFLTARRYESWPRHGQELRDGDGAGPSVAGISIHWLPLLPMSKCFFFGVLFPVHVMKSANKQSVKQLESISARRKSFDT